VCHGPTRFSTVRNAEIGEAITAAVRSPSRNGAPVNMSAQIQKDERADTPPRCNEAFGAQAPVQEPSLAIADKPRLLLPRSSIQHDDEFVVHEHDQGLIHDLMVMRENARQRRRLMGLLAAAGTWAALGGCGGGGDDEGTSSSASGSSSSSSGSSSSSSGSCSVIPEETAGPYPGDGSNSVNGTIANALALTGIVRSDIRSSIAGASGTAAGIVLTVTIELVNVNASCADLSGYAIYLWHCDREGRYSMYSSGVTTQNYLRGVQETGSDGKVTFTTIFPGCYSGRMPHIHFEVYRNANTATSWTNKLRTSQIALPTDVCNAVYATTGYSASVTNLSRISFSTDNIFSDGYSTQLASVTGSVSAGYDATLQVGISV
jgi:protocatechuate 3,4-dioxygenase beta subunit